MNRLAAGGILPPFCVFRGLSRRLPDQTGNRRDGGTMRAERGMGRDSADKKVSRKFLHNDRQEGRYFQLER